MALKIACISDVHGKWNKIEIPECDLLLSTGDYSFRGELDMVQDFHKWLNKQPAKHVISVQGNHEKLVESDFQGMKTLALQECPRVHFIDEGLVEIENYKIWCSAITPFFCNWAWNRYPGDDIQKHWDKIPQGVDIIATHGPCHGILDSVLEFNCAVGEVVARHVGCRQLLKRVMEIKPKAHVCGHIHGSQGTDFKENIHFINASICDEEYKPTNKPIIINLS